MLLDEFDYDLPRSLIAQKPANPKSSSKLLLADKNMIVNFKELVNYIDENVLLIFNDTKVIPAILQGKVRSSNIKITLHSKNDEGFWSAFAKPARKAKKNDIIFFAKKLSAEIHEKDKSQIKIKFNFSEKQLRKYLIRHGTLPVPPYIKKNENSLQVEKNYQTIFAKKLGAFACPTAGLHFDERLLKNLKKKKINTAKVTLHVGAGTFLPLANKEINKNILHKETGIISKVQAKKIATSIKEGKKILAVGTTVLRLLEACHHKYGNIVEFNEDINLFIRPGFSFNIVDKLITNFHLPKSSLLLLVSAFAGKENIFRYYERAIKSNMRFYSYGDAILLEKK